MSFDIKEFAKASIEFFIGVALSFYTEVELRAIADKAIKDARAQRAILLETGIHLDADSLRKFSPEDV